MSDDLLQLLYNTPEDEFHAFLDKYSIPDGPDMELVPPHINLERKHKTPEEIEAREKRRKVLFEQLKETARRPPPSWYHPRVFWRRLHYKVIRYLTIVWETIWRKTLGRIIFIKRCNGSELVARGEMAAIRLVRSHTTVPVPRPLFHIIWRGTSYIFMTRINGTLLIDIWAKLDDKEKEIIAHQLQVYVKEWRSIPVPSNARVSSVIGGPVWDFRTQFSSQSGPWPDESALNDQLRTWSRLERWPKQIVASHSIKHRLCFTHGDLLTHNIFVRGSSIVGIIDWESSGWFPEHWEYLKAHYGGVNMSRFWHPWIPKFIPVFEQEQKADHLLTALHWPCGPLHDNELT